ncbi:unnamed protein product [Haemonchus placei]|uniref:Zinc transporter n=1 Tax=Haemonchus placei TaxID=6290 RepID=A0A158QN76_HAEPC|nr:unnamed protein product [Haemonchus placei]
MCLYNDQWPANNVVLRLIQRAKMLLSTYLLLFLSIVLEFPCFLLHHFSKNSKKVLVMITITFLFFFVELVVGFMNRSIALLADSYHMLSDVMALVIAFVCLRISRRKSKRNGFGWVRAEVLGALVNGVFLLAMCFAISLESIGRLIHSRRISHPLQVLVVGCIGLFINMIGIGMFHGGHGHSHGGGGHGHSHGEVCDSINILGGGF